MILTDTDLTIIITNRMLLAFTIEVKDNSLKIVANKKKIIEIVLTLILNLVAIQITILTLIITTD